MNIIYIKLKGCIENLKLNIDMNEKYLVCVGSIYEDLKGELWDLVSRIMSE